jgi:hypothetical protein
MKFLIDNLIFISVLVCYSYNFQINHKCGDNQYYDTTVLECASCPSTTIPSVDGKSCTCAASAIISNNLNSSVSTGNMKQISCTPCAKVRNKIKLGICCKFR